MNQFNLDLYKRTTLHIFNECSLPNGGIVAAPSHSSVYPKDAKNYFYIWAGRDNGFILAALSLLGIDRYELFLNWIWNRAECFHKSDHHLHSGLLYRSYHPNGLIREHSFQPDQSATLIWSINFKNNHFQKRPSDLELNIINKISEGLVSVWNGNSFTIDSEDIWEESKIKGGEGLFIYSLAACSHFLKLASRILNNSKFENISDQMLETLLSAVERYHEIPTKIIGNKVVTTPDASLLGLIWPFNILKDNNLTDKLLHNLFALESGNSFYRFTEDKYQGADGFHIKNKSAGTWPLIGFWMAIALRKLGYIQKSKDIFNHTMSKFAEYYYIPEQEFQNTDWVGVKPLLWAQTIPLFYLCDDELNHI